MRAPVAAAFVVALAAAFGVVAADLSQGAARAAAEAFGRALSTGHAEGIRPLLPQRGKVTLSLSRMGPEDGSFGSSQVEAVLREFLARGSVGSFAILQCESDGKTTALAHARALVTDREGHSARVGIHLGFQPEDGRWVVREVKESAE
ncbi:MAG TPA: hypothetical protein VMR65_06685 [Candidatus Sulfotelmatobacter sp.]|nr:hypothetical protein [Candidatus Sulfotelmatobacter sp.]